jgi:hypothetical protein
MGSVFMGNLSNAAGEGDDRTLIKLDIDNFCAKRGLAANHK